MGKQGTTTTAEIPDELKSLYRNLATYNSTLASYFGGGLQPWMAAQGGYSPNVGSRPDTGTPDIQDPGGGPDIGNSGGGATGAPSTNGRYVPPVSYGGHLLSGLGSGGGIGNAQTTPDVQDDTGGGSPPTGGGGRPPTNPPTTPPATTGQTDSGGSSRTRPGGTPTTTPQDPGSGGAVPPTTSGNSGFTTPVTGSNYYGAASMPATGGGSWFNPALILGWNPDQIAGMSDLERAAASAIWDPSTGYSATLQTPNSEAWSQQMLSAMVNESGAMPQKYDPATGQMRDVDYGYWTRAGRTPTGITADDPYVQAAKSAFEGSMTEQLKNEMTMAGLGRSNAVGETLSKTWAEKMLMPLLSERAGQQERAIERQQSAESENIGRRMGLQTQRQGALQYGSGLANQMGGQESERLWRSIQGLQDVGKTQRQITQAGYDAEANERNRLSNEFQNAIRGPLGGFVPSTIGSKTTSGGLFK